MSTPLIETSGVGRAIYDAAFPAATGRRLDRLAQISGRTELDIMLAAQGRALPGAHDTLAALATMATVYQAVLTGNLREIARIKLEVFHLNGFLDLDAGAYGDDQADRTELVAVAQQRAALRTGLAFNNDNTVLIGDTPNDVAAALTAGVHVIGVSTGKTSADELREAGATWTTGNVLDVHGLVSAILST